MRVVIVSPPFRSHAVPMAVIGSALAAFGAEVHLACSPAFADLAEEHALGFVPLTVTRNANHGIAERTAQDAAEAARLREFLEATRAGAAQALLTQARHRRSDMLAEPDRVLDGIHALDRRLRPDWYLVDQLGYPVTLALHCLGLRYATFCPGHPTYIPAGPDAFFGLPHAWPDTVRPGADELAALRAAVAENDRAFTAEFRRVAARHAPARPAPERAFALCSPHVVLFNYPPFPWLPPTPRGPLAIHAGHCVPARRTDGLDESWRAVVARLGTGGRPLVLVALGTFLSARDDVLATVAEGVLKHTRASLVVAAGDRAADLRRNPALAAASSDRLHVAASVPQQALLPHVSAMVHHGGNNSFTECLHAGVPALVLPFSSDQFSIAHDARRAGLGICHDPNALTAEAAGVAVRELLTGDRTAHASARARVRALGPVRAAARMLRAMEAEPPVRS